MIFSWSDHDDHIHVILLLEKFKLLEYEEKLIHSMILSLSPFLPHATRYLLPSARWLWAKTKKSLIQSVSRRWWRVVMLNDDIIIIIFSFRKMRRRCRIGRRARWDVRMARVGHASCCFHPRVQKVFFKTMCITRIGLVALSRFHFLPSWWCDMIAHSAILIIFFIRILSKVRPPLHLLSPTGNLVRILSSVSSPAHPNFFASLDDAKDKHVIRRWRQRWSSSPSWWSEDWCSKKDHHPQPLQHPEADFSSKFWGKISFIERDAKQILLLLFASSSTFSPSSSSLPPSHLFNYFLTAWLLLPLI